MNAEKFDWANPIRLWAASERRIAAVYLFGSRARGTNREDSDIDLAVFLTEDSADSALAFSTCEAAKLKAQLAPMLPFELDLQFAFSEDQRVLPAVRDHGILLYGDPEALPPAG